MALHNLNDIVLLFKFQQSACQAAAAHCKKKGKNISKLALQYSLANKDISTVLVGMNSVRQVSLNNLIVFFFWGGEANLIVWYSLSILISISLSPISSFEDRELSLCHRTYSHYVSISCTCTSVATFLLKKLVSTPGRRKFLFFDMVYLDALIKCNENIPIQVGHTSCKR